jgi:hypothetical protein
MTRLQTISRAEPTAAKLHATFEMNHKPSNDPPPPLPPTSGRGGDGFAGLFPDADYRLQMRFQRGSVRNFFNRWLEPPNILEQRRHWLDREPDACSALLPDGVPLLEELIEQSRRWGFDPPLPRSGADCLTALHTLGQSLEPDFLLLKPDESGAMKLLAGCVCFPSSWSLEEKMGRPLDFIHQVVPELNAQLGQPIAQFLRRIAPDIAWLRANWGLSRSPELNQHPKRALPRLQASVKLDEVWLRVEHQALVALPKTGGVLFGIRVVVHPLAKVKQDAEAAVGLRRALQTMPESMATYKGIALARDTLFEILKLSGA